MSAFRPDLTKPLSQQKIPQGLSNLPSPKPLKLDEKKAIDVVSQLLDPKNSVIKINGDYIGKDRCKRALAEYLSNPLLRGLLPTGFEPGASDLTTEVLNELKIAIFSYQQLKKGVKEEEEEIIQAKADYPNVPVQQINQWLAELKEYETLKEKAVQKDPSIASLDLKNQILSIQKRQAQVYGITNKVLEDKFADWQGWSDEDKRGVLISIAEEVTQQVILKDEAFYAAEGKKPTETAKAHLGELLSGLGKGENNTALVLTEEVKNALTTSLADELSSPKNQQVSAKLVQDQGPADRVMILTAPSSQELNVLVRSAFRLKEGKRADKQTKKFLIRLGKNWPQSPNPTNAQIQQIIIKSLGPRELAAIKQSGISEEELARSLSISTKGYFKKAAVDKPFSKNTLRLAQKMKVDPAVLDLWLKGISLEKIKSKSVQKKVAKIRNKRKLFDLLTTIKPSGSGFYHYSILKPGQFLEIKIHALKKYLEFLETEGPKGISGFFQKKRWGLYEKSLKGWKKLVDKQKNPFVKKILYRLPNTARFSWWKGLPYRAIRKGTANLLNKIGVKLAAKKGFEAIGGLLKKAGVVLRDEGFKKLFAKGTGFVLGSVLGLSTAGVGTVLAVGGAVISAGVTIFKIVFSSDPKYRAIRETIKKLAEPVTKLIGAAIIGIYSLIKLFPTTFLLASAGAFFGPAGALLGGGVGFVIDKFRLSGGFRTLFSPGAGISQGAAEAASIGKGIPGLASLAPEAAAMAEPAAASLLSNTPLIAVGGTITATVGLTAAAIISQKAAFVGPAGTSDIIIPNQPSESEYIKIEKIATPKNFENSDLSNPQAITYSIKVTPKTEKSLTNVQIKDSFSFDSNGSPSPINSTLDSSTFPQEISGEIPPFEYSITISGSEYHDTRIRNTFTLTASIEGKTDTVSAFASVEIGNPPVPTSVSLAQAIVEALIGCSGLKPYNEVLRKGVIITENNWGIAKACLEGVAGSSSVISLFDYGVNKWGYPQCVGFVMGLGLYAPGSGEGNADDYCNHPSLQTDWDNLEVGDFVAENFDAFGHVAIVTERSGDIIWLAETMGDTGRVQLRQIGLGWLREKYCGFLKASGSPAALTPPPESTPNPETPETPEGHFTCCYDEECHLCGSSCSSERLYVPEEACIMGTGGYCGAGPINHLCWAHSYYLPPVIPENHFWCCNDVDEKWRVCGQNCDSGYWAEERACERHNEKFEPCLKIVFE